MSRCNLSPWLQGGCWFLRRQYHNPCPQTCQPLHYALVQVITECLRKVYVSWYPETREEDNHLAETRQSSLAYTRIPPFRCPTTHGYFNLQEPCRCKKDKQSRCREELTRILCPGNETQRSETTKNWSYPNVKSEEKSLQSKQEHGR